MTHPQQRREIPLATAIGLLVSILSWMPMAAYADSKVSEPLRSLLTNDNRRI